MSTDIQRPSDYIRQRLRALRAFHKLSQREAADGISRQGYPLSMAQLSSYETGRRHRELPYDFVVAAAHFYCPGAYGDPIMTLRHGPMCSNCNDDPPTKYICRTCHRYRNDDGEVVAC